MKDVVIKIKGTQGIDDSTDVIELTTLGRLGEKNGVLMLSYEEGGAPGEDAVKTRMLIKNSDTVELRRSGSMNSRLIVQRGVRHNCFYNTQFGEMVIGIFGEKIENKLTQNGGSLFMSYTIDSNLQLVSRNIVEINVKEVESNVNSCFTG